MNVFIEALHWLSGQVYLSASNCPTWSLAWATAFKHAPMCQLQLRGLGKAKPPGKRWGGGDRVASEAGMESGLYLPQVGSAVLFWSLNHRFLAEQASIVTASRPTTLEVVI